MKRDQPAGELLVLERLAHHARRAHRQAVVGEPGRAHLGQLRHLGEPLALLADRDRGHEARRDARLGAGALAQRAQHRRRVHHRLGVGLGEDRAEAAGRGGAGAGVDVLLVLAPGRAQVHVRVDERGQRVQALGVDHLGAVRRAQRLPHLRDPPVAHQHVAELVEPGARVEQPGAAHEHGRGRRGRAVELDRGPRAGAVHRGCAGAHAGWGSVSAPSRTPEGAPRPASSS